MCEKRKEERDALLLDDDDNDATSARAKTATMLKQAFGDTTCFIESSSPLALKCAFSAHSHCRQTMAGNKCWMMSQQKREWREVHVIQPKHISNSIVGTKPTKRKIELSIFSYRSYQSNQGENIESSETKLASPNQNREQQNKNHTQGGHHFDNLTFVPEINAW